MTKINWNRNRKVYNGIVVEKEKKVKPVNIGNHIDHKLATVKCVGPHYAKLVCKTCDNKFVQWLSKDQYEQANYH